MACGERPLSSAMKRGPALELLPLGKVRTLTRGEVTNEHIAADRAALPAQKLCLVLIEIEARLQFQHRICPFFMCVCVETTLYRDARLLMSLLPA